MRLAQAFRTTYHKLSEAHQRVAICPSRWWRRSGSKDAIFKNYTGRCGDIPMRERVSDKNEFRS